jgi:hypothetical protein
MVNSPCQSCLALALPELGLILNFRDSIDPEDLAKQVRTNSVTSVMSGYFNNTLDPQTVDQVAGRMAAAMKKGGYNPEYHDMWVSNVETGMYMQAMALGASCFSYAEYKLPSCAKPRLHTNNCTLRLAGNSMYRPLC